MARTRSKVQRQPRRPRPAPRPVSSDRNAVASPASTAQAMIGEEPDWAAEYPHVRGDLTRILVLAAILVAAILVAPQVLVP